MIAETFKLKGPDQKEIFTHKWLPEHDQKIKAIVQIAHGMAEHSARYERFAEKLVGNNFGVYANDHRGHGKTAKDIESIGYFADKNGWNLVLEDMHILTEIIKENHPDIPVFLFGHSMGSFFCRDYICTYPDNIKGAVISGTACDPGFLGYMGIIISKIESFFRGKRAKSSLMNYLSFGKLNKVFKPNRTQFDWLNRDSNEVDKYVSDPFCGTIFTAGFFNYLVKGVKKINKPANIQNTPKDIPMYLLAGSNDPVGNFSKGVKKVYRNYKQAGVNDISLKVYKGARHELINETCKDQVYKDVVQWISRYL
jgi:alpha-beta hydrolase superfamily lysophospholipase